MDFPQILQISNVSTFKQLLAYNRKVVVDFTAKWCGPCLNIAPKFSAMATQFPDLVCAKVDVDVAEDVAELEQITSMPSFKFYLNGVQTELLEGPDDISLWKSMQALHFEIQTTVLSSNLMKKNDAESKKLVEKIRGPEDVPSNGVQTLTTVEDDAPFGVSLRREKGRSAKNVTTFWCTKLAGFSQEHFEEDGATTLHLTSLALDGDMETAVLLCSTQV